MYDREYAHNGPLVDWLQEFADKELQKEGNLFDDIRELFKSKNDIEAVEAKVEELREKVGLDLIEKTATIKHVERAKERGEGTTMKWCVYPEHGGKALGCHDTKEDAERQLRAIEVNKASDGAYIAQCAVDNEIEKKRAKLLIRLVRLAQALEEEGYIQASEFVDQKIADLQNELSFAKDKKKDEVDELPKNYKKYKGLDEFIQNACRTSGGFASLPAIQDRIRKEFQDDIDVKDKDLESYIKYSLNKHKKDVDKEDDSRAGEYVAIIITDETDDDNSKVFDEPAKIK